jgi:hypothetical protein
MKLQFENNEYYLMKGDEELAIATTDESFIKELGAERLSRKNCDAITNMCLNEHCYNGMVGVVYGEIQWCGMCRDLSEWDVEIETIQYGLGNDENGRPVFETRNLLDENACLILKRK